MRKDFFKKVSAIAKKEFFHIYRDWRSLVLSLLMPIFLLVLFGYALSLDVDNVPLTLWNQIKNQESRDLVSAFTSSRYFSLSQRAENYRDIEEAFNRREALAALIIPPDFSRSKTVQFLVDGTDANTATLAIAYAEGVLDEYSKKKARSEGHPRESSIEPRLRLWFNENAETTYQIVPGLIAVIMMVISSLLTSSTISREWEQGTFETLATSPLTPLELLVGKLVPYLIICLVNVAMIFAFGTLGFGVPFRGNFILFFFLTTLFLIGALSMGLMISTFAKNQLLSSQIAMVLTLLPSFLLSGFFNSLTNTPPFVQAISYLVPARYFIVILRGLFLKGVGFMTLLPETLFLTLFCFGILFLAHHNLKKGFEGDV